VPVIPAVNSLGLIGLGLVALLVFARRAHGAAGPPPVPPRSAATCPENSASEAAAASGPAGCISPH